jgi:uncharacterized protein YtpQ (UPF0354 family)
MTNYFFGLKTNKGYEATRFCAETLQKMAGKDATNSEISFFE